MLKFYQNKNEADKYLAEAERMFPGISSVAKGKEIIIASGKHKEIFLISREMLDVFNKMKDKSKILFLGEFFGTKANVFTPSFSTLSKYAALSRRKIIVNQKGEQTFLYGFNLEKKFLISFDKELKIDDCAIVCNEHNETLGLGRIIFDLNSSKDEQKVVKNITDLGWYVRHKEGIE